MAKGGSGRVVMEIDPKLKKELYSALALEEKTLKDWFIGQAEDFLRKKKSLDPKKSRSS
jgi:hypothetical protein